MDRAATGRPNQRARTRKDLLDAAARLVQAGRRPSLEDVADEAMVSRATAYRYFPGVDPLLLEASLDVAMPNPKALFDARPDGDIVARLLHVDTAVQDVIAAHEPLFRLLLAELVQSVPKGGDVPARQNRRTPLIEAAIEPFTKAFEPTARDMLIKALALVIGAEAMVIFKDVLQMNTEEAAKVRHWVIRALVAAASDQQRLGS